MEEAVALDSEAEDLVADISQRFFFSVVVFSFFFSLLIFLKIIFRMPNYDKPVAVFCIMMPQYCMLVQ
jgi:hypothetical protein